VSRCFGTFQRRPDPATVPAMKIEYGTDTALIVVDVQNDFADRRGGLYVKGGEEVIEPINAEVGRAKAAGALVIYSRDWHPARTPHFAADGGVWPDHCIAGTWGADFARGLIVSGEHILKGSGSDDGYSAFSVRDAVSGEGSPTQLDALLRAAGVRRVVVCGLATDYCVKDTALDGRRLGYEVVVPRKLVRAVNLGRDDGRRASEQMRDAGVGVV